MCNILEAAFTKNALNLEMLLDSTLLTMHGYVSTNLSISVYRTDFLAHNAKLCKTLLMSTSHTTCMYVTTLVLCVAYISCPLHI